MKPAGLDPAAVREAFGPLSGVLDELMRQYMVTPPHRARLMAVAVDAALSAVETYRPDASTPEWTLAVYSRDQMTDAVVDALPRRKHVPPPELFLSRPGAKPPASGLGDGRRR